MMNISPPNAANRRTDSSPNLSDTGLLLKQLIKRLQPLQLSALQLQLLDGRVIQLGHAEPGIEIPRLALHRQRAILRGLFGGLLGWAESFMAGDWSTPNLISLTNWAMHNEARLKQAFGGSGIAKTLNRIWHRLRDNSKRGSRRNIAYHYDLGNDFYQLWLDDTMSYSAALFEHPGLSLEQAQQAKYNRILALATPCHGDSILEIGCGWGGFAETVAQRSDLTLHGITLSHQQLRWAQQRMQQLNAAQQIELEYLDYRDLNRTYDRVVSIEMFEAVGEAHWPTYFQTLKRVLKPGGTAVLQIICIDEPRFASYRNNADFIQRYIFPGGMLPSADCVRKLAAQHGFQMLSEQEFGQDYATTLKLWREAFNRNWPTIEQQGYDRRFRRMWEYYLAYCESGFRHGAIDVRLFQLRKP